MYVPQYAYLPSYINVCVRMRQLGARWYGYDDTCNKKKAILAKSGVQLPASFGTSARLS